MVDKLSLTRFGGGHGQPFLPCYHVDERRFAYIRPSDKGIFGLVAFGTFLYIGITYYKFSTFNFHYRVCYFFVLLVASHNPIKVSSPFIIKISYPNRYPV